jgi:AAA15 family ATPase/GTPase
MLSKLKVQHYKSLFDTEVDLEPLTVFIGLNGSGKSNICEALAVLSDFLKTLIDNTINHDFEIISFFSESLKSVNKNEQSLESKFWHGKLDYILFEVSTINTTETNSEKSQKFLDISVNLNYHQTMVTIKNYRDRITRQSTEELRIFLVNCKYSDSPLYKALKKVKIYDFARAVELDKEGKTQVHKLPIDSLRFQKALEAYDGALGELWFTNVFGGNPE